MTCPCGSPRHFDHCCGPFLAAERKPPTAEALMRSRYTAYTRNDVEYIARTFAPESRRDFDAKSAAAWAAEASWLGLQIVSTERGQGFDDEGVVEFVAAYRLRGETIAHRERSRFRKNAQGEWLFVEGATTARRVDGSGRDLPGLSSPEAPKAGRNDPCPCGSGKKFKTCCRA